MSVSRVSTFSPLSIYAVVLQLIFVHLLSVYSHIHIFTVLNPSSTYPPLPLLYVQPSSTR